jgi:hypothetical protein
VCKDVTQRKEVELVPTSPTATLPVNLNLETMNGSPPVTIGNRPPVTPLPQQSTLQPLTFSTNISTFPLDQASIHAVHYPRVNNSMALNVSSQIVINVEPDDQPDNFYEFRQKKEMTSSQILKSSLCNMARKYRKYAKSIQTNNRVRKYVESNPMLKRFRECKRLKVKRAHYY